MVDSLQVFSNAFYAKKINAVIWITISLRHFHKGAIDNKSALVKVMDWNQTGNKPLPELAQTKFHEAIWPN